jgi:alpha-N-acetylglucosamine transferase
MEKKVLSREEKEVLLARIQDIDAEMDRLRAKLVTIDEETSRLLRLREEMKISKSPSQPPRQSSKSQQSLRRAYVSLVMCGDSYVAGAIPLAASLKMSGTKYECVCMVTKDVSDQARRQLSTVFDRVIEIDYVEARCCPLATPVQNQVYGGWINKSFTKWCLLTLIEYEKVLFMDSDVIVLRNLDELFELATPAGTFSNCWGWPYMKSTKRRPLAPEQKSGM